MAALHGLGGVGKTAVALEYAHRHAGEFDVVWWMPAEKAELVAGHVAALGVALGLAEGAEWPAVAGVLRRERLRWLLVLDNVEDPGVVGPFRPSGGPGRLLVTPRRAGLGGVGAPVEVAQFARAEAVGLLAARVPGIDPTAAGRIAGLLGDLPLAMEQAAGYRCGPPASPRLYHLRQEGGRHEVDILVELGGGRVIGIEVKADAAPNRDAGRHLAWLRDELDDRFVAGLVLHTGRRTYPLGTNITAAPIATLWS